MSKQPIPEFNPKKSFKEVSSVPEFDPSKSFTEKKNPIGNDLTSGTQTSNLGLERFRSQADISVPGVLTPKGRAEFQERVQNKEPLTEVKQPSIDPAEKITVGPIGITGLQRTSEYKPAEEFQDKSVGYVTGDLLKTLGKGIIKFPADVLETVAIGASAIDNLIAKTGLTKKTEASKLATYEAAQEYRKLIDEVIPTDKDIENGFWGQSANALGQMVPIILSGFTTGGAKAIATEAAKNGTKLQAVIY